MARNRWLAILVVVAAALAGCDSSPADDSTGPDGTGRRLGLIPQPNPPLLDVPVPIGFELSQSRSRNQSGAGVRFVDHTYTGRANLLAVVRFYQRNMDAAGWNQMRYQFIQGRGIFNFEKQISGYTEECTVIVQDGGPWDRIDVTVTIGPRGPMAVPSDRN